MYAWCWSARRPQIQVVVDQHMPHLGLGPAGLHREPGIDDQHIEGLGGYCREDLNLFKGLHRNNPVIPQLVEHFFDVQTLQVLFIGNQDGQCFVWHGKPLGRQCSTVSAGHFPDIGGRQNQACSLFA